MKFSNLFKTLGAFTFGVGMLLTANVQAAPLNLNLDPEPDTVSQFLDVQYSNADDLLFISGSALELSFGGAVHTINDGSYSIFAEIDDAGNLLSGILDIGGTIDSLGYNSGTLLQGNLNAFGFGTNETLEFTFDVMGGDAASIYDGLGGTIIADSGFAGDFSSDWGTDFGEAVSDTGVVSSVPEPSTYLLMGLGLFMVAAAARRSKATKA